MLWKAKQREECEMVSPVARLTLGLLPFSKGHTGCQTDLMMG